MDIKFCKIKSKLKLLNISENLQFEKEALAVYMPTSARGHYQMYADMSIKKIP